MKRVTSSFWIENCCQLMIAPGVFVMVSALPLVAKEALPAATLGPEGLANRGDTDAANAAPTARLRTLLRLPHIAGTSAATRTSPPYPQPTPQDASVARPKFYAAILQHSGAIPPCPNALGP